MAPKRKGCQDDIDARIYWLNYTARLRQQPTKDQGCIKGLGSSDLILGAHQWGEAMVRAYLQNLADKKVPACDRRRQFDGAVEGWYKRGYRYYLLPKSKGAPEAIAEHKSPAGDATEGQLIPMIDRHATHWMKHHSVKIRVEVLAAEEDEKEKKEHAAKAEAQRVVRQKRAPTPTPTTATTTPATVAASKAPCLRLHPRLARLLDKPTTREASTPLEGIRELVVAAFENDRVARVWNDCEDDNDRRLTFLDTRANELCDALVERGLGDACGRGCTKVDQHYEKLKRVGGLALRGKGAFNGVWESRGTASAPWVAELLPAEVATPFYCGRVVLRCPTPHSDPLTFDQAVDEATNILFTALAVCGPRVAALCPSVVGRWPPSAGPLHGARQYQIYTFLETATLSVDARYAPTANPSASAIDHRLYHDALLMAIYRISVEGYVHLDATLRNFVDFYPKTLPETLKHFAVKVIDVEGRHFRRLIQTESTEWRYLFLFNLMIVMVFLKTRLADCWSAKVHWNHLRDLCKQLIGELPGKHNIASVTMWEGEFPVLGEASKFFPDLGGGALGGNSIDAVRRAALWQLKHYLLRQPIREAQANYTSVLLPNKKDPSRLPTTAQLKTARDWFNTTYRRVLLPPRTFFDAKLREKKRFVEVAFEFLETSIDDLRRGCANAIPPMEDHHRSCSEHFLLGV